MPDIRKWVWWSMNPGSITRPAYRSSISCGTRRSHGSIDSSVPTDTIDPSATATAVARGRPRSIVWIRSAVNTRAALLSAAAHAIVESGPAASVADIARRASVSTGALQHHFVSKTDLLIEVVRVGWDDLVERSTSVDRSVTPIERGEALVSEVWESYRRPECRAAFMISSDPSIDADVALGIAPVFDAVRVRLDDLWQEIFADLELPVERVALARRFARSHLAGMVVQLHMASAEPAPDEELDLLVQATLRVLTEGQA